MLEIFGSIAASEAGKFVLEKGQAAAEDYVKGLTALETIVTQRQGASINKN
jgi:hypothetical protein